MHGRLISKASSNRPQWFSAQMPSRVLCFPSRAPCHFACHRDGLYNSEHKEPVVALVQNTAQLFRIPHKGRWWKDKKKTCLSSSSQRIQGHGSKQQQYDQPANVSRYQSIKISLRNTIFNIYLKAFFKHDMPYFPASGWLRVFTSLPRCSQSSAFYVSCCCRRPRPEPQILGGQVSTLLLIYQTDVSLPSNE